MVEVVGHGGSIRQLERDSVTVDQGTVETGDDALQWKYDNQLFSFIKKQITATASSFLCKNDHMLLLRTKFDSFANAVFMKKSKLLKCNENCEGQRLR